MPENDFSRISRDPGSRKIGEAPNIGKVPRSPQSAINRSGTRRGKSGQGRRPAVIAWSLLFAFVAIAVVVSFVVFYFRSKAVVVQPHQPAAPEAQALADAFSEKIVAQPPPGEDEAVDFVRQAMRNRDTTLVAKFFRLGSGISATDATAILDRIGKAEGTVGKLQWLGEHYANGTPLQEVVVFMDSGERHVNRLAQLVPSGDGEWRIDFDSYIRVSSPDWATILSGNSPLATVRVFIAEDTYYNGIFSDDTAWKSYALVSPDTDDLLYSYVKSDSPQHKALDRILSTEDTLHRATLEIRRLPGAGKRQFEISRVLAENWVLGRHPFDENF